jgi:hypothetical protein
MEGLCIEELRIKQRSILDEIKLNADSIKSLNETRLSTIEERRLVADKTSVYIANLFKLTKENTEIERLIKKQKCTYEPRVHFKIIEDDAFNENFDKAFGIYE